MKLVSIIIPIYNVELYLKDCLNSIINQTYNNLEIICINDGSNDNSLNILKEYQKNDERIKIISRENRGLLASRLEGLENASGEYIINVDSDDYLELNTVEILIDKIEKYNVDIVRFQHYENNKLTYRTNFNDLILRKENFEPTFYDLFFKGYSINSACYEIFKRKKFNIDKKIDTSISMGEDIVYNLNLYPYVESILFIDNHLYHYRVNQNSITRNISVDRIKNNIESAFKAYSHLYDSIDLFPIKNKKNYSTVLATRFILEIYYLELKLLSITKRYNNQEIQKFILDIDEKMKKNNIYYSTKKSLLFSNARGHKFFVIFRYSNNKLLTKLYSKCIYKPIIKIRSVIYEIKSR